MIWSWKHGNMSRNKITSLLTLVNRVCSTTLSIFLHWISKLCIQKYKNYSKTSSGMGRFSQIFVHVKTHNSMNVIVNQEDTIDNRISCIINYDTKQHQPTFNILVWRLRARTRVKQKLLLFVHSIEWFVLLIFVKILLVMDL